MTCPNDRGAFLVLGDYATRSRLRDSPRIKQYVKNNLSSWWKWARAKGYTHLSKALQERDIIFVTGTIKTSAWTAGVFVEEYKNRSGDLNKSTQIASITTHGSTIMWQCREYQKLEHRNGNSQLTQATSTNVTGMSLVIVFIIISAHS